MISEATSGFGALSCDLLTHLQDEYSSKCVLLFNVTPPPPSSPAVDDHRRLLLDAAAGSAVAASEAEVR